MQQCCTHGCCVLLLFVLIFFLFFFLFCNVFAKFCKEKKCKYYKPLQALLAEKSTLGLGVLNLVNNPLFNYCISALVCKYTSCYEVKIVWLRQHLDGVFCKRFADFYLRFVMQNCMNLCKKCYLDQIFENVRKFLAKTAKKFSIIPPSKAIGLFKPFVSRNCCGGFAYCAAAVLLCLPCLSRSRTSFVFCARVCGASLVPRYGQ